MGTPYKMKGHTLPGIKQKKSPVKDFGLISGPLIAAAVSAAIGAGAKAAAKPGQRKKAAKLEAQNKAKEASAKSTEGMGDIGTKTKLTD